MRCNRLVIEAQDQSVALALHPRLTVVAGVDRRVRTGLAKELIGALGPSRSGVSVELTDDAGRDLALQRPTHGPHRIVDGSGAEVSEEFRDGRGCIDVLGHHGLDMGRATASMYLDRARLQAGAHRDEAVDRLAALDQTELWSCAARVRITEEQLQAMGSGQALSPRHAQLVERIEARHQEREAARRRQARRFRYTAGGSVAALVAAVAVALVKPVLAVALVVVALAAAITCLVLRARGARSSGTSRRAEAATAPSGGSTSDRFDGALAGAAGRKGMAAVAEDHRAAAARWAQLAGEVSVDWALAHHGRIEGTAQLRRQIRSLDHLSATAPELGQDASDLAEALHDHLGELRHLGTRRESFPLILDDPFTSLAASTRLTLMDVLAHAAGPVQVIVLTEQDDVATWARLEALTGQVGLVEPRSTASRQPRAEGAVV